MRRRRDRNGETALHRHALVKPDELHRDLALVVEHRDNAVVFAGAGLDEDGVAGERPLGIHALVLCQPDAGCDVIDLLAPELAGLTRMGVEGAHGKLRAFDARSLDHAVQEGDGVMHRAGVDAGGDVLDGHVGGHPGRGEPGDEVEFRGEAVVAEDPGKPAQFILLVHAGIVQGTLVQRLEEDRIGLVLLEQLKGTLKVEHRPGSAGDRCDAALGCGTVVGRPNGLHIALLGNVRERHGDLEFRGERLHLLGRGQQRDERLVAVFRLAEDLDCDLRANSRGVTDCHCNAGNGAHDQSCPFSRLPPLAPGCWPHEGRIFCDVDISRIQIGFTREATRSIFGPGALVIIL